MSSIIVFRINIDAEFQKHSHRNRLIVMGIQHWSKRNGHTKKSLQQNLHRLNSSHSLIHLKIKSQYTFALENSHDKERSMAKNLKEKEKY